MPNRSTDALFQLVKSLEKSEKRNFKLFVKRNSSSETLKTIQLFDALDKMTEYDESQLLKKNKSISKVQLSNIKAALYKQILSSLRIIKDENNIDIQLHELMDHARILFNKGLYLQSLKVLKHLKDLAGQHHQITYLEQVLFFEKKIETLYITRSMRNRADQLSQESDEVTDALVLVNRLSNLALQLYSWYIQHGHARNEKDMRSIHLFFQAHLPADASRAKGFYEKLYLYQSYCWYAFIRQDFLQYYRYAQKWVDLFESNPLMIRVETSHYIKGLHYLLNAHFDLRNYKEFATVLKKFEQFAQTSRVQEHDNFRIQAFVYISTAKINQHFMHGTFKEGLKIVPDIEAKLEEYALFLDQHRIMVMNYKIATLYFGSGDYSTCIDYLQKIMHNSSELRTDLQCYSRVLHLLAHYELGNFELMESLTKSVYRFMAKMENLTVVEEEMFKFLRHSFHHIPAKKLKPELETFLQKIKHLEKNRFETRAFAYLDLVSWVESKVYGKQMGQVIHEKYLASKRRN